MSVVIRFSGNSSNTRVSPFRLDADCIRRRSRARLRMIFTKYAHKERGRWGGMEFHKRRSASLMHSSASAEFCRRLWATVSPALP